MVTLPVFLLSLILFVSFSTESQARCANCRNCDFSKKSLCTFSIDQSNMNPRNGKWDYSDGAVRVEIKKPTRTENSAIPLRGRAEIVTNPMLVRPYFTETVRITYTFLAPSVTSWGANNEPGCIAQFQETGGTWVPAFLLMLRANGNLDFAVLYGSQKPIPVYERTIATSVFDQVNTIEITARFTTGTNGFYRIKLNGQPLSFKWDGRTLPTGNFDLQFKVGAYAMDGRISMAENFIMRTSVEVLSNAATADELDIEAFFAATAEQTEQAEQSEETAGVSNVDVSDNLVNDATAEQTVPTSDAATQSDTNPVPPRMSGGFIAAIAVGALIILSAALFGIYVLTTKKTVEVA